MVNALDLIDAAIAELEAKLNLPPGDCLPPKRKDPPPATKLGAEPKPSKDKKLEGSGKKAEKKKKKEKQQPAASAKAKNAPANTDQPDICKLEFKVGQITKVWIHPDADKLYCEEIDCGEGQVRQIASGLRMHYDEEGMLGRRVLVVSNLKAKNLVGFKSHGMVLCAAETKDDGTELVEFIEPPEATPIGEVVTFEGLPPPEPFSGAQVEKKKVFAACMKGMKTTDDGVAAWNGHKFVTTAGVCKSKTIKGGVMR